MRSSDFLFQLIKSLSKGERRNFKLFTKLQEGDKQYIKLFEAIDAQDEYDEKSLLEGFQDEKFVKQFSVAKNYLHNYILRTLHIFHRDSQTEFQSLLHQVLILKSKNLFEQSYKILRKAKLMAERHERFQELLQMLQIERELLVQMNKHQDFEILLGDIEKMEKIIQVKSQNLMEYYHLTDHCFILLKKSHTARKDTDLKIFDPIFSNPLIKSSDLALSVRAKMQRVLILIDCYHFAGHHQNCENFSHELIGLYESNREIMADRKLKYLTALSYLSVFQQLNQKDSEALETLIKLKNHPAETDEERIMIFEKYYSFIIGHSISRGKPELGLAGIEEIENNIRFVETKLRKSVRLSIYYLSGYFHLFNGNPSAALRWTNMILNEPKSEMRLDLQCMARILNLMIHFELGNKDLIEYFIKSTTRFLAKRDYLLKFEKAILHFFNQVISVNSQEEIKGNLLSLKNELIEISKDPFEKKASQMLDIEKWINSRLQNISMNNLQKIEAK